MLLGLVKIQNPDKKTQEDEVLMKNEHLNELAYTELVFLIDVRRINRKVLLSINERCKRKDYKDGKHIFF
jgi:hypothetical protein